MHCSKSKDLAMVGNQARLTRLKHGSLGHSPLPVVLVATSPEMADHLLRAGHETACPASQLRNSSHRALPWCHLCSGYDVTHRQKESRSRGNHHCTCVTYLETRVLSNYLIFFLEDLYCLSLSSPLDDSWSIENPSLHFYWLKGSLTFHTIYKWYESNWPLTML